MKIKYYGLLFILLTNTLYPQCLPEVWFDDFVYTGILTGYDVQSWGSPQQICKNEALPTFLNAVMMKSDQPTSWTDRKVIYLFSSDNGRSWENKGYMQTSTGPSRAGFPVISSLNDGRIVAADHSNDGIVPTRTMLYSNTMFPSEWTNYDPGPSPEGEVIWPRILGYNSTKVFFISSVNGSSSSYLNSLDMQSGIFSGWQLFYGGAPEAKKMAKSSDGQIIGLCFVGNKEQSDTFGDLYYIESNDAGLTWSEPVTVYEYNQQDSLGAFQGVDITFLDSNPYIVYEIVKQNYSQQSYEPTAPSKIMLWSPAINGGTSIVIADSNNVPYFPSYNYGDMLAPVCRPVIASSENNHILFVAFNATTGYYETYNNIPCDTYFAGYFMYSGDLGTTWAMPEKFTPEVPLKDWRYISITSIVELSSIPLLNLNMVMLADTNAGTNIFSPPGEESVSAEIVGVNVNIGFDSPCLNVFYPRENESLVPGTQRFISWFSNDIDSVKIEITTDSGISWSTIISNTYSDGFIEWYVPNTPSNNSRIKITSLEDTGVYGYSGYFKIENTTSISENVISDIPKEFSLKQNYPNPFNPSTTIYYDIPSGTDVTITLYNILGQMERELVNEYKSPGKYKVNVDMTDYKSGVYFYKLQAGGYVETKKMILLK